MVHVPGRFLTSIRMVLSIYVGSNFRKRQKNNDSEDDCAKYASIPSVKINEVFSLTINQYFDVNLQSYMSFKPQKCHKI